MTVGHCTLAAGDLQTGVTVVRPHAGDPFVTKVPAAAVVINGFGKSVGLLQVNELGVLETPIALTNTFSVGTVATAQIRAAIAAHPGIARTTTSVNPLVFECSDAYLSDMQALAVTESHYAEALAAAAADFARGSVGAGRGMSCFGLKGGIGSASRRAAAAGHEYALGALVLANFGKLETLTLAGRRIGPALARRLAAPAPQRDSGSIIVVLATDAPLDHRQLRRVATRAAAGIGAHRIVLRSRQRRHRARVLDGADGRRTKDRRSQAFANAHGAAARSVVRSRRRGDGAGDRRRAVERETVTGFRDHVRHALIEVAPDWTALEP